MRSPQSNAMERRAGAGWPSSASAAATPGADKATTRYPRGSKLSERQQEFDPRGGAERAGANRLDLGGEPLFPNRQPAEQQDRGRQATAAAAAGRATRGSDDAQAVTERFRRTVREPTRQDSDPVARRIDQPQGRADR